MKRKKVSNSMQNINEISPMSEQNVSDIKDEVKKEYLEGKSLLERGEIARAAASLHNAFVGFEEKNDEGGMANALNQLGLACFKKEEYDTALEHFMRAEEICRKLNDPLSVLALSRHIVEVQWKKGNVSEAINRCLEMLDFYQANNNPKGTVELLEYMADIYIDAGDHGKAADAYKTIASIHRNFKHDKIAERFLEKAAEIEERQ